jgi:hypothetical protein
MYGQDVVMLHTALESIRTLQPAEAVMFLEWLDRHREDLYKATKEQD